MAELPQNPVKDEYKLVENSWNEELTCPGCGYNVISFYQIIPVSQSVGDIDWQYSEAEEIVFNGVCGSCLAEHLADDS